LVTRRGGLPAFFSEKQLQISRAATKMLPLSMATSGSAKRVSIPGALKIVLFLLAVSIFINYIDRSNLSIAAPMLKDEFGISSGQLGRLLAAFFVTYASFQLVSGWLVDRFNVNWVFAGGFLLWSGATAGTGMVHAFSVLFVLRLLLGIGESVAYPAYSKIIILNFPEEHRGFANSVISSGLLLGPGFGLLLGGLLMARFGWRSFFMTLGVTSMLWLVPWLKWMPKNQATLRADVEGAPGLLEFLGLRPAWGTCLGQFGINYVSYFLLTWLPYYLVRERHFSLVEMAKIGGIAYLLGACLTAVSGWLSDRWISAGGSPSVVRKTFVAGGLALAGVFVGFSVFSSPALCIAALMLGVIFFGVTASNVWAITQTLAGQQAAGRWTGFQNFTGNLAGIVVPWLTGWVLQRTGHFYWAFVILAAVAFAGAGCWIFLVGPVQQVTWRTSVRSIPRAS
jgi:MFS transporter, ACS family, D-galactonate transporter